MRTRPTPVQVFLLGVLLLALPAVAQAQFFAPFGFETNDGQLTITYYDGTNALLAIPSSTNDLPVTGIAGYAFFYNGSVTNISIPAGVTNIADLAFAECTSLIAINVAANNPAYSSSMAGVLFNKNQTALIAYPDGLMGGYLVPASVTSLEDSAFYGCTGLTSVSLPAGVTNLGEAPFGTCTSLAAINVNTNNPDFASVAGVLFNKNQTVLIEYPEGNAATNYAIPGTVTDIESNAFDDCAFLTNITIPTSTISIGNFAFSGCSSLTNITIPNSVTNLGYSVFEDCVRLASVTLPDHLPGIADDVFNSCSDLATITIPNSVTNIGLEVFASCSSLTNLVIGTNVAVISYAFPSCTSLATVSLPASVISVAADEFYECPSLTAINVAANNPAYASVAGVLFNKNQTALIEYPEGKAGTSYAIPDTVTNIGGYAFVDCAALTAITIPDAVNSIGNSAFGGAGLTSIAIPGSVTNIGSYAFDGCTDLTNVCFEGSPPAYVDDLGFYADPGVSYIYYVAEATGWGPSYDNVPTAPCAECAAGVVPGPSIASFSLSGTNLVLNGINNQSSGTNYILMSTNLALSLGQWTRVATDVFSASGNFTVIVTNTVSRTARQRFYLIQTQ